MGASTARTIFDPGFRNPRHIVLVSKSLKAFHTGKKKPPIKQNGIGLGVRSAQTDAD